MADARFSEEFWTDPKIKNHSIDVKLLAIYLFTNTHRNYCGIYYLPKQLMALETGLSDRSINRSIDTLSKINFLIYDQHFQVVWVKNMLKHQIGKSQNLSNTQQIGIVTHLATLHKCPLINDFLTKYEYLQIPFVYQSSDTPINTPTDTQSQSQSQSKSKSKSKSPISPLRDIPLPDNFTISDAVRSWAKEHTYNHLEQHLEWFRDWAKGNGKLKKDWDATFRNAIRGNWAKIDLYQPEVIKPIIAPRTVGCPKCGRWIEKCICEKEGKSHDFARNDNI